MFYVEFGFSHSACVSSVFTLLPTLTAETDFTLFETLKWIGSLISLFTRPAPFYGQSIIFSLYAWLNLWIIEIFVFVGNSTVDCLLYSLGFCYVIVSCE